MTKKRKSGNKTAAPLQDENTTEIDESVGLHRIARFQGNSALSKLVEICKIKSQDETFTDAEPVHGHKFFARFGLGLAVFVCFWSAGNVLFGKVSLGKTSVSMWTSSATLSQAIQKNSAAYKLPITYADGQTKRFAIQDVGVSVDVNSTVRQARRARLNSKYFLAWWKPAPVLLQTKIDTKALANFIAQDATMTMQPAVNASISVTDAKVTINSDANGKAYGLGQPVKTILDSVENLRTRPLNLQPVELKAAITTPDLSAAKQRLESIFDQSITLTIDQDKIQPKPEEIAKWVDVKFAGKTVTTTVNADNLHQYLDDLSTSHNRDARSEILLDTSGKVLQSGEKGISIGDTTQTANIIANGLLSGKGLAATLPINYTGYATVRAPTTGKWVDVDTSTKRMYAYDQGQLVRTFLISSGAAATPTVIGRFAIYAKYVSQDMSGPNTDGSRYVQPDVPYVNYFYQDFAVHGNYWRPASYFGNVNSSHGCVGLTVSDSEWFYDWAPIGTPVIVHT